MRIEKLIDNRAIVIRIVEQKEKRISDLARQQVQVSIELYISSTAPQ